MFPVTPIVKPSSLTCDILHDIQAIDDLDDFLAVDETDEELLLSLGKEHEHFHPLNDEMEESL